MISLPQPSAGRTGELTVRLRKLSDAAPAYETGVYNVAEDDGTVCSEKALRDLSWRADFRLEERLV